MESSITRGGSQVKIYERTPKYIFGAWEGNDGEWYPARWYSNGKYWPNEERLLDLIL